MKIVYRMVLDLQHPNRQNIAEIKQKDYQGHLLEMTLLNNGVPMDMSDVAAATLKGIYDGTDFIIYTDATIRKDEEGNNTNVVEYEIGKTIIDTSGRYTFELELLGEDHTVVSSFEFYIVIRNTLYDEDDYLSESDLSGFRSYMLRTFNAAKEAENVEQKFEIAYGTVEEAVNKLNETEEHYAHMLEDLEEKVETGYFIGPAGPQGENGHDAIVTDLSGLVAFEIKGKDLFMQYGAIDPPDVEIVGADLVWSWED